MFTVKYSRKLACVWVKALFGFLGLVCEDSRFRARFGGAVVISAVGSYF